MTVRHNTLRHALFVCTVLSFAVGAQAQEFIDIEETPSLDDINDTASGRIEIRSVPNRFHRIRGKINREGDVDLWGFDLPRSTRAIGVFSDASRVLWSADLNRNFRTDDADRTFLITRGSERHTFTQRNGVQVLAKVTGEPNESYSIVINSLRKPQRAVTATFLGAEAIDRFDGRFRGNRADFRASVRILDPDGGPSSSRRSKKINNDNKPSFDLDVDRAVDASTRNVPITLRLVDVDGASKDEVADISPNDASRSLDIVYDAFSKVVRDSSGARLGTVGEVITSQGTDKRRARISFRVDSQEPVGVPTSARVAASN